MGFIKHQTFWHSIIAITLMCVIAGCSVSYKFNGASINYNEVKTIQFSDFPLRSAYVWAPMHALFNNELQDIYMRHPTLRQQKRNPHWQSSEQIP